MLTCWATSPHFHRHNAAAKESKAASAMLVKMLAASALIKRKKAKALLVLYRHIATETVPCYLQQAWHNL
jgi:hypothetical protein